MTGRVDSHCSSKPLCGSLQDSMNAITKRFKDDLQLAGYAERSISSYISSVFRLQRFYNKQLEDITEAELRQYWLSCQNEFGWSAAILRTVTAVLNISLHALLYATGIFSMR